MKKALCVLLSVVMLLSMSVTAFAADTKGAPSQTLPSWLPDDAPAPDPNSEISIVHFYINEDGETIVYDPETERRFVWLAISSICVIIAPIFSEVSFMRDIACTNTSISPRLPSAISAYL